MTSELSQQLLDRIPDARPGYWDTIDQRLANIEAERPAAIAADREQAAPTDLVQTNNAKPRTPYVAAAAALIVLVALGAVAINSRFSTSQPVTVAYQDDVDLNADRDITLNGPIEPAVDATNAEPRPTALALPPPIAVNGETPLVALQTRVLAQIEGASGDGAGTAGPFCFQSHSPGVVPGETPAGRTIGWLEIATDGTGTVVTYQPSVVPPVTSSAFVGTVQAGVIGAVTVESSASGDVPANKVEITDGSLQVYPQDVLTAVACSEIQQDVAAMFALLGQSSSQSGPDAPNEGVGPDRPDGVAASYMVVAGDTLGGIANTWTVSLDALLAANPGLDPSTLQVGQTLVVPPWGTGLSAAQLDPRVVPVPVERGSGEILEHVVAPGDLLSDLAATYGVTVKQIVECNGLGNPGSLQVGQILLIPPPGSGICG